MFVECRPTVIHSTSLVICIANVFGDLTVTGFLVLTAREWKLILVEEMRSAMFSFLSTGNYGSQSSALVLVCSLCGSLLQNVKECGRGILTPHK